jgi:hypothetical protein
LRRFAAATFTGRGYPEAAEAADVLSDRIDAVEKNLAVSAK